jgi:hypothetical protein
VANFAAPLATYNLQGAAIVVLASGFLNPAANSNGPDFGLLAVLADGTSLMLTNTTGIGESPVDPSSFSIYPNPSVVSANVAFSLDRSDRIVLKISDLAGRTIYSTDLGVLQKGSHQSRIGMENIPAGIYMLNIESSNGVVGKKLVIN